MRAMLHLSSALDKVERLLRERTKNEVHLTRRLRQKPPVIDIAFYGHDVWTGGERHGDYWVLDFEVVGIGGTDEITLANTRLVINDECGEEDTWETCDVFYPIKWSGYRVVPRLFLIEENRRGWKTLALIFELRKGEEP